MIWCDKKIQKRCVPASRLVRRRLSPKDHAAGATHASQPEAFFHGAQRSPLAAVVAAARQTQLQPQSQKLSGSHVHEANGVVIAKTLHLQLTRNLEHFPLRASLAGGSKRIPSTSQRARNERRASHVDDC